MHLGAIVFTDLRGDDVRLALNEYANDTVKVLVRGSKERRDTCRPRSAATVHRMRAALGTILRHARTDWGIVIPARKERNKRRVFLTEEQARKLLAAARVSSWCKLYLFVLMGAMTGARRGSWRRSAGARSTSRRGLLRVRALARHLRSLRPLLVAIFGWVAEQERERLRERTRAGLERARREGKRLGRPPAPPVLLYAASDFVAQGMPAAEAARRKGIARSTLQRFIAAS